MSVKVDYSEKKIKGDSMKAGNKGIIKYSIIDSQKAELTINAPVCEGSKCSKKLKYSVMSSDKLVDLYTQLVCPTNFFASYDSISIPPITQEEISPKENSDGTLSFEFKLIDQISYIGIKATTGTSG